MTSPGDTGFMPPQPRAEPLVLSVTEPLTQRSVASLGEMIDHTPPARTVIIDVTGISDFDSFGTSALLALQERVGPRRLVVVGIKQAAERLVAADDLQPDDGDDERGHRRPVPGIVVVTPTATTTSADLL